MFSGHEAVIHIEMCAAPVRVANCAPLFALAQSREGGGGGGGAWATMLPLHGGCMNRSLIRMHESSASFMSTDICTPVSRT